MIANRQPVHGSDAPVKQTATNEFASLPVARACLDAIREEIGSLGSREMIEAVERLHRAYREFPELESDRPRRDLLKELQSAAASLSDRASVPLLIRIVAFAPFCLSSIKLLLEKIVESKNWELLLLTWSSSNISKTFHWNSIEPLLHILRQPNKEDITPQIFSALLKSTGEQVAANFCDGLARLLSEKHPIRIDNSVPAKAAPSEQLPPSRPPLGSDKQGSRDLLLAMAQRLRIAPAPQRANRHHDLAWPSGRMSFDEFLMQWPCEVELPVDLDDRTFIEGAYQAILLRGPGVAETSQYLRLLQNRSVSKSWIIEDLLASEEFRSFERRLRVIWGGDVITEPGRPEAENMPAVTWPWRSAT
jgi:hypothetical protein